MAESTRRWTVLAVVGFSACLVLAACSGSSPPQSSGANGSTTTTHARSSASAANKPTKVGLGSGSIGPSDPTTTVPQDLGQPIAPQFGAGQNAIITSAGCMPQTLEANVTSPIVWTNLSGKPQRLVFLTIPVDSGTIPPGGTFTWSTNNALTLSYKLLPSGQSCKVAVNQANP